MTALTAQISTIACPTEAEGPGRRWALWFQGCSIRCPGCCNPHLFSKNGGKTISITELISNLDKAHENDAIEGITLLGGEPTEQLEAATILAEHAQSIGLTVLVFTGKKLEELKENQKANRFLEKIDILVDGPFDNTQPETKRRWIGSSNQRIHLLSKRASYPDPRWELPNTLEITLRQGSLLVNGFPLVNQKIPLAIVKDSHGNHFT